MSHQKDKEMKPIKKLMKDHRKHHKKLKNKNNKIGILLRWIVLINLLNKFLILIEQERIEYCQVFFSCMLRIVLSILRLIEFFQIIISNISQFLMYRKKSQKKPYFQDFNFTLCSSSVVSRWSSLKSESFSLNTMQLYLYTVLSQPIFAN